MKTEIIRLYTDWIYTESLDVTWYNNGQMYNYIELKNGRWNGDHKHWSSHGALLSYGVFRDYRLIKEIV